MKIKLSKSETTILQNAGIDFHEGIDISEDEAEELLDRVRDFEVRYAHDADINSIARELAVQYGDLADKIQETIDDE